MPLRDREKTRSAALAPALFSPAASPPGLYRKKQRTFCLQEAHSDENLCSTLRQQAMRYFAVRKIDWHDGVKSATGSKRPSNHLCCSQSFCVNVWFPFIGAPRRLAALLATLGFDAAEALPMEADLPLADGRFPYVAFEWIGLKNYLKELVFGKIASDLGRTRGAGFTSADVAVRFRRSDGKIQIVLMEWKYTETYSQTSKVSSGKTDRLGIYLPELRRPECPIRLPEQSPQLSFEALFYDPFDQMMRVQLLAAAMERAGEMHADVVTFLHLTPRCNAKLNQMVTSTTLRSLGTTIHEVWGKLVAPDRFQARDVEDVIAAAVRHAPDPEWASYVQKRFAGMR